MIVSIALAVLMLFCLPLRGRGLARLVHTVATLLLFLLMWIVQWTSVNNPDWANYKKAYEYSLPDLLALGREPLFSLLMETGKIFGLDYQGFFAATSLLSMTLLYLATRRYTGEFGMVLALYLVFSYTYDLVQMRSTLALSFIIFGFRFLTQRTRGSVVAFLGLVGVATLIHFSSVLVLPFALAGLAWDERWVRRLGIGGMIVSAIAIPVVWSGAAGQIGSVLSAVGMPAKVTEWFTTSARFGFLVSWFKVGLVVAFILYLMKAANDFGREKLSPRAQDFLEILGRMTYVLLAFSPLLLVNSSFERLVRPIIFASYIGAGILAAAWAKRRAARSLRITLLALLMALLWLVLTSGVEDIRTVLVPVFIDSQLQHWLAGTDVPPPPLPVINKGG
ncbi:MAG: EpsG family protein [Propionibacteriaceae bacterium]|nr:EpsG family protein [Propionibacteriaceae bacterium]